MTCTSCGTPNREQASHCAYCGRRLTGSIVPEGFWAKLAITISIPVIAYLLMTQVLLRYL